MTASAMIDASTNRVYSGQRRGAAVNDDWNLHDANMRNALTTIRAHERL
jgi:hypothetical protein